MTESRYDDMVYSTVTHPKGWSKPPDIPTVFDLIIIGLFCLVASPVLFFVLAFQLVKGKITVGKKQRK